ncbi:hypothetical protein BV898_18764 [Hypsibius exemplaris]|uniref:Major facilitator superfamily (MFS) profile domain-containing protein n=1 Tax=Hypsibius exemplaris TaxID=2072580 RepID=A0A9X6NJG8_HYPEX|nr:hypothetical protein BV898_18764 [Hypsibius exemplaris]
MACCKGNRVGRCITNHYQDTTFVRSERQLEWERWLIPGLIPFTRYLLMPASVLIQMCCGSLYAWSGFNLPIERKIYGPNGGKDRAIAVNVFYVAVAIFAISAAVLGPWLERRGPLRGGLLGASLFYFGNLLTALGVYLNIMPLVYIGYGVFGGAGLGICYIAPISPLQKWFPEMRGVAAGLAVCGFGAGSIFSPFTQNALIGKDYAKTGTVFLGIELTFVILGSCYFVVMGLCSIILRMPPPGYHVRGINIHTVKGAEMVYVKSSGMELTSSTDVKPTLPVLDHSAYFSMTLMESLQSYQYWMIYFMFLGAEITGLLIISKIQSIASNQFGRTANEAASINSGLGGMNLLGRLILPLISDLLGARKPLYCLSLAVQAICLGCLPSALANHSFGGTLACAFIIGFFYGGGFGMIPAFLADQFGAKNVGATHGVILTAWAIAAVCGGLIFTAVYNAQSHIYPNDVSMWYNLDFRWILAPVLFSFLLSLFIPANLRDRKLPRAPGETFRYRFINGRLIRFTGCKMHMLTAAEEEAEWQTYLAGLSNLPQSKPVEVVSSEYGHSRHSGNGVDLFSQNGLGKVHVY